MTRRPKNLAKKVAGFALEKKAEDIQLFDLRDVTSMTDFFVICTGTSDVHVKAIADAILEGCKKSGIGVHGVEGYDSRHWVLIDLVDVVIHIFHPETRRYYQLERLWGDADIEYFGDEGKEAIS